MKITKQTFTSLLTVAILLFWCEGSNAQKANILTAQELSRIAYCLQETSKEIAIPESYWLKNGTVALRYLKGVNRQLNLGQKDIVLVAYSPNGKDARIYIVWIADEQGRPEFTLRQMAGLWKEKGRWRSEYPTQGGLGSLQELEKIHRLVIKRPVVTLSRADLRKHKSCPGVKGLGRMPMTKHSLVGGVLFIFLLQSLFTIAADRNLAKRSKPLPAPVMDELLACMTEAYWDSDVHFTKPYKFQYVYGPSGRNPGDSNELFIILHTKKPNEAVFWDVFVIEEDGKPTELGSIVESQLKRDRSGKWHLADIWDGGWTGEYLTRAIRRVERTKLQLRAVKLTGSRRMPCSVQDGWPVWR